MTPKYIVLLQETYQAQAECHARIERAERRARWWLVAAVGTFLASLVICSLCA